MSRARPRVFIGLVEVAGYYTNLREGFRRLGVPCTFVTLGDHGFDYGDAEVPGLSARFARWAYRKHRSRGTPKLLRRTLYSALDALGRLVLFLWALPRFDAFVMGYASRFGFYDLALLRLFGRRVIYFFHGSDSRPPYLDATVVAEVDPATVRKCVTRTRKMKRAIRSIERRADAVISYPLHSQLHERPIVFSTLIGIPIVLPEGARSMSREVEDGTVRILHCPSHRGVKGSARIRAAVDRLQEKGLPIEFVELTGVPHAKVLEELARCDFVVDQLFNEGPVAGFPTEAAAFGKPAITGSYGEGEIREIFGEREMFPVHLCHPDRIEAAIEKLATDAAYRRELGARAHEFVAVHWRPERVAERFLDLIAGDPDPSMVFDPALIRYVNGVGMPEERARASIRAVIESSGEDALGVSDKPELLARMTRFAD